MNELVIHRPGLETVRIGTSDYLVDRIVSISAQGSSILSDYLKKTDLKCRWKGDFLEGINGRDEKAQALFNTPDVGIVYFLNRTEPNIPLTHARIEAGDLVELVYIEKDWETTSLHIR